MPKKVLAFLLLGFGLTACTFAPPTPEKQAQQAVTDAAIAEITSDLRDLSIEYSSTHRQIFEPREITVDPDGQKATVKLSVTQHTTYHESVFPLRKKDGRWQLGCNFARTTSNEPVWLPWTDLMPGGSKTLIGEYVVQNGFCPTWLVVG